MHARNQQFDHLAYRGGIVHVEMTLLDALAMVTLGV